MASPHARIEQLLAEGGRYDVEVLPQLEACLKQQLKDNTYSLEANLAMLKLYLLYPEHTNVESLEKVLLKALMAFPATDFYLCLYQIPEKYHANLKSIMDLAQQLEMAKFKTFWKDSADVSVLSVAIGWESAIRKFIAGVVSSTYRSIKADQLRELLNLEKGKLDAYIEESGWSRSKTEKDIVIVSEATFQEPVRVEPKPSTNMTLDQYRTLFMAASSA
mmetsp:Transcript_64113/g.139475  ORF Transcript_64113/g.139475 Transcript_64113/m.139475 type:complete len:219 (+) Transcript_64113:65-721(+)|eukprot:CAMPEP_0170619790 /NCGR_PEP_ID=MMETSP0224-20130122/27705_1 /TAXON_ID=285029 /ORGANISM="Togula jolla, Strain CCCM 725" /LENGTH=218 /DNA_ID=CAMNT_0010945905 /DNA_START=57 /DNA_END=713 /DNA_ORIENTATION=-